MKSDKSIGLAFAMNLAFSLLEAVGGWITGSVAILSDAVHDFGDACSIGVSFWLERKSKKGADNRFTYGYARWSVIGGALTSLILLCGSVAMAVGALHRLFHPAAVHSGGMLILAAIGVVVNGGAAFITRSGASLGQKAVNLHMLEDVLSWLAVLCGAAVMYFTGWMWIDPLLSIGVSVFIALHAVHHLREALSPLLECAPDDVDTEHLQEALAAIDGVENAHHLHLWSIDGRHHCATVHLVTSCHDAALKARVRAVFSQHGIDHVTVETEALSEADIVPRCTLPEEKTQHSGHAHSHHHH